VTLTAVEVAPARHAVAADAEFPAPFLEAATMFMHARATVNGEKPVVRPLAPKSDAERD